MTRPHLPLCVHAPSHTYDVFNPAKFPGVVDWVAKTVERIGADAIAVCGHSGLVVGGAVAYKLGIPLLAVRKPDDHAKGDPTTVNGAAPAGHTFGYAFVDDFVCSGATIVRVANEIRGSIGPGARLRWIIAYVPGTYPKWYKYIAERFVTSRGEVREMLARAQLIEREPGYK